MPHIMYLSSFTETVLNAYKDKRPDSEVNVLLSFGTKSGDYPNMRKSPKINSMALDSGAFTKNFANAAATENITLDGFIAYCKWIKDRFELIFNYDENFNLGGFETNTRNMMKIEAAGISVVPVVHDYIGQVFNEIDFYLRKKYPIIALGSSVHKKSNRFNNIKTAVDKIVSGGSKVHLLGLTSPDILGVLPIHYSDATSWTQEGMFGNVIWWNPYKNGINKTDRVRFLDRENSDKIHSEHIENYPYRKYFEKYLWDELQLEILDIYGHEKNRNRQIANVHHFVKLQDIVRQMHIKNGFDV
jgi:hypothetical protein